MVLPIFFFSGCVLCQSFLPHAATNLPFANGSIAPFLQSESMFAPLENSSLPPLAALFSPTSMVIFLSLSFLQFDSNHIFGAANLLPVLVPPISLSTERNSIFQPSCSLTPPTWEDNPLTRREPTMSSTSAHHDKNFHLKHSPHSVHIHNKSLIFTCHATLVTYHFKK